MSLRTASWVAGIAWIGATVATFLTSDAAFLGAVVIALVVGLLTRSSAEDHTGALTALALGLVLLAVYFPQLGLEAHLTKRFPTADATEAGAVLGWARWVSVALAALCLAAGGLKHGIDLGVGFIGALVLIAAVVGVASVAVGVFSTADAEDQPAFERGFSLAAAKIAPVARDLKADRCVVLLVVRSIDPEPDKEGTPPVFETTQFSARLIDTLTAGVPTAAVTVEVGGSPKTFAAALAGADSIHILSTSDLQDTSTSAKETGCAGA